MKPCTSTSTGASGASAARSAYTHRCPATSRACRVKCAPCSCRANLRAHQHVRAAPPPRPTPQATRPPRGRPRLRACDASVIAFTASGGLRRVDHALHRPGGDRVVARLGLREGFFGELQAFRRLHQLGVGRHDQLAAADLLQELGDRRIRLRVTAAHRERIPALRDLAVRRAGELVRRVERFQLRGVERLAACLR